ncbi:aspartate/glutamate racemase family protein [Novosphingobium jiangmenense]|uniref:Amino acid racemase n=1 Tax=Novosphingobium jiangmenense TaxID=2791981 RepID=A0ABS0HD81_9SPHN|nr:amino acid racemase [Novosphingobium jiangmenense]MBF9149889.1 amino acid racemase [Novosphingobium jiangmenense]
MRKIGLIGGMSWVSTRTYYEDINQLVQARTSKMASAPLLIESLDFTNLIRLSTPEQWDHAAEVLTDSARRLEQAGATALLIGANSMHKVYDQVAAAVSVPVIHIADAVGAKMKEAGVSNATLIGTRNVVMESFYRKRLVAHGVSLLPPVVEEVEAMDKIIYDELMLGKASRSAERTFKTMLTNMGQRGAQAAVLACTELDMVIDVDANVLPIFDGTRIHAQAAVDWILG